MLYLYVIIYNDRSIGLSFVCLTTETFRLKSKYFNYQNEQKIK